MKKNTCIYQAIQYYILWKLISNKIKTEIEHALLVYGERNVNILNQISGQKQWHKI